MQILHSKKKGQSCKPHFRTVALKQLGEIPSGPDRRMLLGAVKRALESTEFKRTGLVCAVTLASASKTCEFECELLQCLVYGALDGEVTIQSYMHKGIYYLDLI